MKALSGISRIFCLGLFLVITFGFSYWPAAAQQDDFIIEVVRDHVNNIVHFREVQPETGSIDYKIYLKRLAALPQEVPLMLEHLETAKEYSQAAKYIRSVPEQNDLSFA